MSDRAGLRQTQIYPMRGGVIETALYIDELTNGIIADRKHLQRERISLDYKIKGPETLALVSDCSCALDMPGSQGRQHRTRQTRRPRGAGPGTERPPDIPGRRADLGTGRGTGMKSQPAVGFGTGRNIILLSSGLACWFPVLE
jgi:hypothetical protein